MRRLLIVLRKQIRRLTHCRDKILRKGAFPLSCQRTDRLRRRIRRDFHAIGAQAHHQRKHSARQRTIRAAAAPLADENRPVRRIHERKAFFAAIHFRLARKQQHPRLLAGMRLAARAAA